MSHYKHVMLVIALAGIFAMDLLGQCNGYAALCSKRYDEVAYLTTHNAYNAGENNFLMPNQNYGITKQLNDGVRGLMLDVHNLLGTPVVYHGVPVMGTATFSSVLDEIKTFLDNNPDEVVTVILESYVSSATIESSLSTAGLLPQAFAKDSTMAWPTLQEMINTGKRLVLFSDVDDGTAAQDWYMYVWDHAVETQFSVSDTASFDCSFNRGDPANDLFIFNHFISDALTGTGSETQAAVANSNPFMLNRIQHCMQATGKFPNFVTVDFYDKGDALAVVNTLNGVNTGTEDHNNNETDVRVMPNPAHNEFHVIIPESIPGPFSCKIYAVTGKMIQRSDAIQEYDIEINIAGHCEGIYFIEIVSGSGFVANKMIVIN